MKKWKQTEVKSSITPPPDPWVVPERLKGLTCALCGLPFTDGDVHGEIQTDGDGTMVMVCRTRKVEGDDAADP